MDVLAARPLEHEVQLGLLSVVQFLTKYDRIGGHEAPEPTRHRLGAARAREPLFVTRPGALSEPRASEDRRLDGQRRPKFLLPKNARVVRIPRDRVCNDGKLVEELVDVFCSAVRRREQFPECLQIDGAVSRRRVALREDRGPPPPSFGAPLSSDHLPAPVRLQ